MHRMSSIALVPMLVCAPLAQAHDRALVVRAAVVEGDAIPGVGLVTTIERVAINSRGQWLAQVDTNSTNTLADRVVVSADGLEHQEGEALLQPAGAFLTSFETLQIDAAGHFGSYLAFSGLTPTTDSGVFFDSVLLLQESGAALATGFAAGTKYVNFHQTRINDAGQIVVVATVDDPTIPTTGDRAIVVLDVDGAGVVQSQTVFAKEGDILAGQTAGVADFGLGPYACAFSEAGDVMFHARTTDVILLDNNIYVNQTLVAREGTPSPVAGRDWVALQTAIMDLSSNGAHYVHTGILTGSMSDNELVVRNGAKFVQEGDALPDFAPFALTTVLGALQITNAGHVIWIGRWSDPDQTKDTGLFIDDQLVLQEGVSSINGFTIASIVPAGNSLMVSPNGRHIIFEAQLAGGLNGAFVIDLGPWTDLGGALPGASGAPRLLGMGQLEGNEHVSFDVTGAAPNAPCVLVLGPAPSFLTPFFGGSLVPSPQIVLTGFSTDSNGSATVQGTWFAGVPSGSALYAQGLVADAGAPFGVAITNAVVGITP